MTLQDRIRWALHEQGRPMWYSEIANVLMIDPRVAARELIRMREAGGVELTYCGYKLSFSGR